MDELRFSAYEAPASLLLRRRSDDLLVSPASVDLAGVMIVPRKDDFVKITAENIRAIFNEVCIDDSALQRIVGKLNIG